MNSSEENQVPTVRFLCFAHLIKFYILTDTAKLPSSLLFIYKARKRKFREISFHFVSLLFSDLQRNVFTLNLEQKTPTLTLEVNLAAGTPLQHHLSV